MPFLVRPTCAHEKRRHHARVRSTFRYLTNDRHTTINIRGHQKGIAEGGFPPKSFPRLNRVSPDSVCLRNTPRQVLLPSLRLILVRGRIATVRERTGTSCQSPQDRSGDREHRGGLARSKFKFNLFLWEVIIDVIKNISQESATLGAESTFSQRVRKIVIGPNVGNT